MTEEAKAARAAYNRKYYSEHKDRIAENKRRYWERKAAKEKEARNAAKNEND